MNNEDYFDKFLEVDELPDQEKQNIPSWVNEKNSSLKAYKAIEHLKAKKKAFIGRHSMKSQYTRKSDYQIQKVDVAKMAGIKPQPLFNSSTYSEALRHYLELVNEQLEDDKSRKIARNKGGLRRFKKEEIIKQLQTEKKVSEQEVIETVDAVFERTINKLALDVKVKLGLSD